MSDEACSSEAKQRIEEGCPNAKRLRLERDVVEDGLENSKVEDSKVESVSEDDGSVEVFAESEDRVTSPAADGSSGIKQQDAGGSSGYDAQNMLREGDVFITEYISNHQGFSGIIKQRVSDFHVREIDMKGRVQHLTDIEAPQCDQPQEEEKKQAEADPVPDDWCPQLDALISGGKPGSDVTFKLGECDKTERRRLHQALKAAYPQVEGRTEDLPDGKVIIATLSKGKGQERRRRDAPSHGEFTKFLMYKENKDTMEAVNVITSYLRVKPRLVQYAGTKDRRAKTTQQMCIRRMDASRLYKLNTTLRGIVLGNFSYSERGLRLGDLSGNHFTVILRNVTGTSELITQAVSSLQDIGFINYFGMQRFGTTSVPTHHIGRAILKSNWEDVVELILKPRAGRQDRMSHAREVWWESRDASKALEALGRQRGVEGQLLTGLQRHQKNDLVGAIGTIPRNGRLLYLHSYQSYVWNCVVSRRLREYGLKPVLGDLVMPRDTTGATQETGSEEKQTGNRDKIEPVLVTSDQLDTYTIHDVVLPMPGNSMRYPDNQAKDWYIEILQEDSLSMESFNHKIRDYCLSGDYRRLVIRPDDVTSKEMHYDDVTQPLVLSDYEELTETSQPQQASEGRYKAVCLTFSLPPSTYATMALREILKTDTSAAYQSTLNVT